VDIELRAVPQLGARNRRAPPTVHGQTQNVSNSGVCLITDWPLEEASLVRCDVALPYMHLVVPTLMQVRWTRESGVDQRSYTSGLQFLF